MQTTIINGKIIAQTIEAEAFSIIQQLSFQPILCDIIVGSDPVVEQFVAVKRKAAERVGLGFEARRFDLPIVTHLQPKFYPDVDSQVELVATSIDELNNNPLVCGIIVQLPLPFSLIQSRKILNAIDPKKDVDCLSALSGEKFYAGLKTFSPPAASAVVRLLESTGEDFSGRQFLIIGQGQLVGRPVAELLRRQGSLVQVADKSTKNLSELLVSADVVISAAGSAGLISGEKLKSGVVIIDAGTSDTGGSIRGDVDTASVIGIASHLAPVPGGVGPVAVAQVVLNVAQSAMRNEL